MINCLPPKDISFANKFIETKNYEALKELTWSSLQRMEIAAKKGILEEKYPNINMDDVRTLALECYDYYYLLYPEELLEDDYLEDEDI